MKNKTHGKQSGLFERHDISAANLPAALTIQDPAEYIRIFRSTFLKKVREEKGLSVNKVAELCDIDKDDLTKIESGTINEQFMMQLNILADFYEIDYHHLLILYKLARAPSREKTLKMAACHTQKISEETQKMLAEFIERLQETY